MYAVFKQLLDKYMAALCPGASGPSVSDGASVVYTQNFTLSDDAACGECPGNHGCDKVVMAVETNHPVGVFHVADYIAALPAKTQNGLKNCDFIMCDASNTYGSRKVALCDLSCSEARYLNPGHSKKYPQGKRAYVVEQMISTADFIARDIMVGQYIRTATSKRFVFGLRVKDMNVRNKAMNSMKAFSKTPSSQAATVSSMQTIAGIDFEYVEVRHPAPLRW